MEIVSISSMKRYHYSVLWILGSFLKTRVQVVKLVLLVAVCFAMG